MKKASSIFFLSLAWLPAFSQEVEMADSMRSDGKIYVVVAILSVILVGLLGYLVSIDRKAARLEKKLDENRRP